MLGRRGAACRLLLAAAMSLIRLLAGFNPPSNVIESLNRAWPGFFVGILW